MSRAVGEAVGGPDAGALRSQDDVGRSGLGFPAPSEGELAAATHAKDQRPRDYIYLRSA